MAQYYAWSPVKAGTTDEPKSVARGEKVSQSSLGLNDADWQALVDSGAVRDRPFPAPDDYQGSALDYLRDQLAEAQTVSPVDEEEAVVELANLEAPAQAQVQEDKSTKK